MSAKTSCNLLKLQLLQLASQESKEYPASWLKSGKTIHREGGRFASKDGSTPSVISTLSREQIANFQTFCDNAENAMSEASESTKKAITDFYKELKSNAAILPKIYETEKRWNIPGGLEEV
jgi:hypothetical protein